MTNQQRPASLHRDEILSALAKLNDRLAASGATGELCLFGGSVMVLVFNARLSTRDVDAIFQPATLIREMAAEIAKELNWQSDWLNDGAKGFQSDRCETTPADVPQFANLRIYRPTTEYLLAMKCMASPVLSAETGGDEEDIRTLIQNLKLVSSEEVLDIVARFFPPERIPAKTQFMIHEVIAKMNKADA